MNSAGREYRRRVRQAEKNQTQAKHEAARTVNNNFRAGRDALFTGTVDAEGMERLVMLAGTDDPDELLKVMRKEIVNLIRRTRYELRGSGVELRYFAVPADLDGKKLTPVRVHCHIIVNREAAEAMEQAWTLGTGGCRTLYGAHHGDLTDLVEYLIGQTRQVGTEKRYIRSRNLVQPEASKPRLAKNPNAELRVPKGASLIWKSEQRAGRPQRIWYYVAERDAGDGTAGSSGGSAGSIRRQNNASHNNLPPDASDFAGNGGTLPVPPGMENER